MPGRSPVGTGTHYPDHVPNPGHALVAVLAAVRHRRRTGEGQQIELAQFESTVNVIGPAIVATGLGSAPTATGNRTLSAAPHAAFRCRDEQWIVLSCDTDAQWAALERALGLSHSERRATLAGRKADEDTIEAELRAAIARLDRPEAMAMLDRAVVPNAPVNSSRDIVEEPGLWARGFWRDIEHPVIGRIPIARSPFRLVDDSQSRHRAPTVARRTHLQGAAGGTRHDPGGLRAAGRRAGALLMPGVRLERSGSVGWVTMDRPEQRNALDLDARLELAEAFRTLDADPAIRVAVLTGAGTAFCAGTDLSGPQDPQHPLVAHPQRLTQPLDDFTKPLIAAVNGAAAGGGFEFALAADLRVASPFAKFLLPEVSIGSLPGSGGTQRIFSALPSAIAGDVLFAGRVLTADDAMRYGLVSDVYPSEEFAERVGALAARVAAYAPLSLIAAKRAARVARDSDGAGLELERSLWAQLATTQDREEGRTAFREKRPPRFEGR